MKNLIFLFLFFISILTINAQNDTIVLVSQDVLIGQIKKMTKGVLIFKTNYSDADFRIKWSRIKEVYSSRKFILDLSNGQRMVATINTEEEDLDIVNVDTGGFLLKTTIGKIISLDPTGDKLSNRIDASFELGITFAKASNLRQINGVAALSYHTKKWEIGTKMDYTFSQQDSVQNVRRVDANVNIQRILQNEWFIFSTSEFLSSSELGLELRSTTRIGPGYYIKQTNISAFAVDGGLTYNHETFSDAANPDKDSYEAYVGVAFERYDIGDFSIVTSLSAFPSLTEKGRFRSDIKIDLKYDFFSDFFVKLGWSYNFDNQPALGGSKDDYVFKTTFGWELD